jgi:hypothetical protein
MQLVGGVACRSITMSCVGKISDEREMRPPRNYGRLASCSIEGLEGGRLCGTYDPEVPYCTDALE